MTDVAMGQVLSLIGRKRRNRMFLLLPAMLLASLLEMAGLAMIVAVCSLLISDNWFDENVIVGWMRGTLHIQSEESMVITILSLLIGLYVFKLVYLSWENYAVAKFVRTTRNEMTIALYGRILRSPYSFFVSHTTAEIQNLLIQDMFQLAASLSAYMQVIMETLVVAGMGICLLLLNTTMTVFVAVSIVVLLIITRLVLSRPIRNASERQREANRGRWKWLHYTTEGIKDIKTGRREAFFEAHFARADTAFARSDYLKQFWTKLPSLYIEAVMVISVLLYLLFLVLTGGFLTDCLPGLTGLVWTAVRLLPACSRINAGMTDINYAKPSVQAISEAMEETAPAANAGRMPQQTVGIREGIVLRDVSYAYEGGTGTILRGVSLEIPAGSSVGITGVSGEGKTTLLDILLGLLSPSTGQVEIDGVPIGQCRDSYLDETAYVPQNIFLLDDTIRGNVAMGLEDELVDDSRIWDVLERAALADKVRSLPLGLDTQIGERGIRLSGGERQRLGLARAMYRNPSLIVFDEATSALDLRTESSVIESIDSLKGQKTLIIVSHRESAIMGCDRVYCVENGTVRRVR